MQPQSEKPEGYADVWRELPTLLFIPLTQGKFTVIDGADAATVATHDWHTLKVTYPHCVKFYAQGRRRGERKKVLMHRVLLGFPKCDIDHENGDSLDNRRRNLRACSRSRNLCNRTIRHGSNKYRGVSYDGRKQKKPWRAEVKIDSRRIWLGTFRTAEDAAVVRDVAALKHQGEFCTLNFPDRRPDYLKQIEAEKQSA